MENNLPEENKEELQPQEEQDPTLKAILEEEEEELPRDTRKIVFNVLKYVITFLVAGGLVFAVLGINSFFQGGYDKAQMYRKLADAFSVPGLLFILFGLMAFVAQKGAFTGLGYALRHLGRMLFPFLIKKDITYAEYIENKEQRKTVSMILCFLLIGAVYLIVGVIFIFLFYKYYVPSTTAFVLNI